MLCCLRQRAHAQAHFFGTVWSPFDFQVRKAELIGEWATGRPACVTSGLLPRLTADLGAAARLGVGALLRPHHAFAANYAENAEGGGFRGRHADWRHATGWHWTGLDSFALKGGTSLNGMECVRLREMKQEDVQLSQRP